MKWPSVSANWHHLTVNKMAYLASNMASCKTKCKSHGNFTFHGCWIAEWYHPISKHCMCLHLDGSYWYLLLASVQCPGDQAPGCCALQGVGILQGETLILRWAGWTFPRCFWRFKGWIDVKRLNGYQLSALNETHIQMSTLCRHTQSKIWHTLLCIQNLHAISNHLNTCSFCKPPTSQVTAITSSQVQEKGCRAAREYVVITKRTSDSASSANSTANKAERGYAAIVFAFKQNKIRQVLAACCNQRLQYVTTKIIEQSSDCIIANVGHFFQTGEWAESGGVSHLWPDSIMKLNGSRRPNLGPSFQDFFAVTWCHYALYTIFNLNILIWIQRLFKDFTL